MRPFTKKQAASPARERAGARAVLLAVVCFGLGIGAGALWFQRPASPMTPNAVPDAASQPPAVVSTAPAQSSSTPRPRSPAPTPDPATPTTIEEVRRAVPNLATVSLEEGTRIIRAAALKDFAAAADQGLVSAAQQRLALAQKGGSEAEQQAAMKELQQIQDSQTEKLQEIAARTKAQIEALQQLKASAK